MPKHTLTYTQAQEAVQKAGWSSQKDYRTHWRDIPGLPSAPELVYTAWQSWYTFLGIANRLLSLEAATATVQKLELKTSGEYRMAYRQVPGLPADPEQHYSDFPGWGIFLGTGRAKRTRTSLSFPEARLLARSLDLRTATAYFKRAKENTQLPNHPEADSAWQGWADFLGFEILTYAEAQQRVQSLGIKSAREYTRRYKEGSGLLSSPYKAYSEWISWPVFLGLENPLSFPNMDIDEILGNSD